MGKKHKQIEHKTFKMRVKQQDIDNEGGTFSGHASVFNNTDFHGDIVARGAFKRTIDLQGGKVPILWQHDSSNPIGVTKGLAEDDRGLFMKNAQLVRATQRGREALALLREGAINGLSIGFETLQDEFDKDKDARVIKEVRLWEISLVTFPANPKARVEDVKEMDSRLKSALQKIHVLESRLKDLETAYWQDLYAALFDSINTGSQELADMINTSDSVHVLIDDMKKYLKEKN